MDLFESIVGSPGNLLPKDGDVKYYDTIMSVSEANKYLDNLLNKVEWKNDEVINFGKRIVTKRKIAWYGDKPFKYTYSNTTKQALPWINELQELKKLVEKKLGETFNSCLLNLYHNGSEGMTWHSDAEKDLKINAPIASLSFGAERKFSFKHKKTEETVSLVLQHGSLLVMEGETQSHWLHSLPTTKKTHLPRVNLTFRTIVD
jgi:alkylated DNA repair dioxygenase AlkB